MFSIEPSYYAVAQGSNVTLRGVNFDELPDDAIGLISYRNDNPLQGLNLSGYQVPITDKTAESLVVEVAPHSSSNVYGYVGAIVSSDLQTIYWRNDTKPLP